MPKLLLDLEILNTILWIYWFEAISKLIFISIFSLSSVLLVMRNFCIFKAYNICILICHPDLYICFTLISTVKYIPVLKEGPFTLISSGSASGAITAVL